MTTLLVFIPSFLYNKHSSFLRGKKEISPDGNLTTFFVLGQQDKDLRCDTKDNIGYFSTVEGGDVVYDLNQEDYIILKLLSQEFTLTKVVSSGKNKRYLQTICLIYDYDKFQHTELLLTEDILYRNNFQTLCHHLKTEKMSNYRVEKLILILISIVIQLLKFSAYLQPVFQYSMLGSHVHALLEGILWALKTSYEAKRITLKVGNFLVATLVNIFCGIFVLYCVPITSLEKTVVDSAEMVVETLRSLLKWLMGNPAGLKLNYALTNMLGQFFLYHITLWWTFLIVTKPLMQLIFSIFLWFGHLGVTFQASILADLLAIISFHVYCIYVYAARLFNLQVTGLQALWRLFRGKKLNPLRDNRVDSCQYTADQLFIGTLAFTILLFLLPTVLLYYGVFMTLRLQIVALGGVLSRVRYTIQTLPLYVTLLWLVGSQRLKSCVHLTVRSSQCLGDTLVISVQLTNESLSRTLSHCRPEVATLAAVDWGQLLMDLVSGNLIYPV